MGQRHKARECALQILFELEFDSFDSQKTIRQYWQSKKTSREIREYTNWLVHRIVAQQKEIDSLIQSSSEHWRIARMSLVDRNVLRLAVLELLEERTLAPAIVINEAIEIAKKFSDEKAATFVNGVLDAVRKKLETKRNELKEGKDVRKKRTSKKRKIKSKQRSQKDRPRDGPPG
jgi:N utilization substance protein B